MHCSHTHGVEAHEAEHYPIESLRLHHFANEESQSSFFLTVIRTLLTALYAGAGKTWREAEITRSLIFVSSLFGPITTPALEDINIKQSATLKPQTVELH